MQPLWFQSAVELTRALRARSLRSRDLLELFLDRIDRYDSQIRALVVQDRQSARRRADEADAALDAQQWWGPLHGLPITIKEAFNWAGFPTTWGLPPFKNNIARADAVAVARLKQAGAIVVGKTNVSAGLADSQTSNELFGITHNPWDLSRGPGGSSGGSAAALAAGLTGLELGSDIGGSIRNPAHFCGVFGHKPTFGLVPARGHTLGGLRTSDMGVVGPLARSATNLELALRLLAHPDELDAGGYQVQLAPLDKPCSSLRVAVWGTDPVCPVGREVEAGVERVTRALRDAGAEIDTEARPEFDVVACFEAFRKLLGAALSVGVPEATFRELESKAGTLEASDQSQRARSLRTTTLRHRTWMAIDELRTKMRWAWHHFFQRYDFVLMPVMPIPAFAHDDTPYSQRIMRVDGVTRPYEDAIFWAGLPGMAYLPSTALPAGLSAEGLPVGVQIVGPAYGDLKTIQLAALIEARGFAFTPPPGLR